MLRAKVTEWGVPPLYAQEKRRNPKVYLEITLLGFSWQWLVLEAELQDEDILFFGYVKGDYDELGYFTESELRTARLPIITQRFDPPKPLSKFK